MVNALIGPDVSAVVVLTRTSAREVVAALVAERNSFVPVLAVAELKAAGLEVPSSETVQWVDESVFDATQDECGRPPDPPPGGADVS